MICFNDIFIPSIIALISPIAAEYFKPSKYFRNYAKIRRLFLGCCIAIAFLFIALHIHYFNCQIPNLVGRTVPEAEELLLESGITPKRIIFGSGQTTGKIIKHIPGPKEVLSPTNGTILIYLAPIFKPKPQKKLQKNDYFSVIDFNHYSKFEISSPVSIYLYCPSILMQTSSSPKKYFNEMYELKDSIWFEGAEKGLMVCLGYAEHDPYKSISSVLSEYSCIAMEHIQQAEVIPSGNSNTLIITGYEESNNTSYILIEADYSYVYMMYVSYPQNNRNHFENRLKSYMVSMMYWHCSFGSPISECSYKFYH